MEELNLTPENCIYTQCYCEENIWKLCKHLLKEKVDVNQFHVVFISNANKQIPLWFQKSSQNNRKPVVWDYHVILVHVRNTDVQVYDFDTTLDFPCSLKEYAISALQNEQNFVADFCRYFRVIPAAYFLKTFASDRSHMRGDDGNWLQPPPCYPPIKTQESSMNLFQFIDMCTDNGHGTTMNMKELLERFHCNVDWPDLS